MAFDSWNYTSAVAKYPVWQPDSDFSASVFEATMGRVGLFNTDGTATFLYGLFYYTPGDPFPTSGFVAQIYVVSATERLRDYAFWDVLDIATLRSAIGLDDPEALIGTLRDHAETVGIHLTDRSGLPVTHYGSEGPDSFNTVVLGAETPTPITIYGMGGNDTLESGEAGDTLYGGDGIDSIYTGYGDDLAWGGADGDFMRGGPGNDTLHGETGDDTLEGYQGADVIFGGSGNDYIEGDYLLILEDHDDTLHGDQGNDTIGGGRGADLIFGGDGDDILFGEDISLDDLMIF